MDFHPKKLFYFFFTAIAARSTHDVEDKEVEDDEVEVLLFF